MSTVLDAIAAHARERVKADRQREPLEELKARCTKPGGGEAFYAAIRQPGLRFICEIKRASPSKGLIDPVFDYLSIARAYEAAGADAVSCLTEPRWFLGSDAIFADIRLAVTLPATPRKAQTIMTAAKSEISAVFAPMSTEGAFSRGFMMPSIM